MFPLRCSLLTITRFLDLTTTVEVGPEKQRFVVSTTLLINEYQYFRAALRGEFREAHVNLIYLEEEDPEIFDLYVRWLYTVDFHDVWLEMGDDKEIELCLKLCVLAERMISPDLQNRLVGMLCESPRDDEECFRSFHLAWENTAPNSPLHTFLMDFFSTWPEFLEWTKAEENEESCSKSFLRELVAKFCAIEESRAMSIVEAPGEDLKENLSDRCQKYHTHRTGWKCG